MNGQYPAKENHDHGNDRHHGLKFSATTTVSWTYQIDFSDSSKLPDNLISTGWGRTSPNRHPLLATYRRNIKWFARIFHHCGRLYWYLYKRRHLLALMYLYLHKRWTICIAWLTVQVNIQSDEVPYANSALSRCELIRALDSRPNVITVLRTRFAGISCCLCYAIAFGLNVMFLPSWWSKWMLQSWTIPRATAWYATRLRLVLQGETRTTHDISRHWFRLEWHHTHCSYQTLITAVHLYVSAIKPANRSYTGTSAWRQPHFHSTMGVITNRELVWSMKCHEHDTHLLGYPHIHHYSISNQRKDHFTLRNFR